MPNHNTNHFDLETLRSNLEYDDTFVAEFLTLLKQEFEICLAILRKELQGKGDIKKINITAHRMKGTALNGCCGELVKLTFTLEHTEAFDKILISNLIEQIESEIVFIRTLIL